MGRALKTLTKGDLIEINRRMIHRFGGIFFVNDNNLVNPGSLDHVLEAIQGSLFGVELYPSIFQKAAAIAWRVIVGHVFYDGNKRTGIEACRIYLEINGYEMRIDYEVVEIALRVATREIEFDNFVDWLVNRTDELKK